jgi:hypothetical protein
MTKKMDFGGVGAPVVTDDFGAMGFSLNPLDWFSSSSSKFSKEQEYSAGLLWLQQLHTELRPNATLARFLDSLKLNAYNERISEEDYQDFVRTVGFSALTNKSISDRVRAAIIKNFSSNKNMLPTRRSISSAFLNPDNVKWTYWDATKVAASAAATTAKETVSAVSSVVSAGASTLGFVTKNLPVIAFVAVAGFAYFIYRKRAVVADRLSEKALGVVGLGE